MKDDLMLTECELGRIAFDEIDGELDEDKLTGEQKARLRQVQVNAEVNETVLYLPRVKDPETRLTVIEDLVAIHDGGVHPNTLSAYRYWDYLAQYAIAKKQPQLLRECIDSLKEMGAGGKRIEKLEKSLEELK